MTPDPIAREKYLKLLVTKNVEVPVENFEVSNVSSEPATTVGNTFESTTIMITTTTVPDEYSDEDYSDPDIDEGLKPACLAALCAGK